MRISDWSSDVCSSDLQGVAVGAAWAVRGSIAVAGQPPVDFCKQIRKAQGHDMCSAVLHFLDGRRDLFEGCSALQDVLGIKCLYGGHIVGRGIAYYGVVARGPAGGTAWAGGLRANGADHTLSSGKNRGTVFQVYTTGDNKVCFHQR